MTSREKVVATAIYEAAQRDRGASGPVKLSALQAISAIEASDAWLKERHEPALWAASDRIMEWTTIRDMAYYEPGLPHALARYCIGGYLEALPNIEPEEKE